MTKAVVEVWGADRIGARLSPYGVANGSGEPGPMLRYTYAVEQLNPLGLAYLHFIEPRSSGAGRAEVNHQNVPSAMVLFRPIWKGVLITAGGFTGDAADAAIRDGHADAIAFGRIFISNPDLPRRLQRGFPPHTLQSRDLLRRRRGGLHGLSGAQRAGAGITRFVAG